MTAERSRQHPQALRGPAEMQFLGRRNETAQLMQFHDAHSRPEGNYIIFLYKRERIEFPSPELLVCGPAQRRRRHKKNDQETVREP